MFKKYKVLPAIIFFLIYYVPATSHAVSIQYNLISQGGNDYRYVYTVTNDGSLGSGTAIELFDIEFDTTLYAEPSLLVTTPASLATNWSEAILGSAPGLPAVYDSFALSGGVADGATVSGFSVDFTWLGGPGGPGNQTFQIFDPNSFALLETGTTSPVPVPGALILLLSGLTGLLSFCRRRR